MRVCRTCANNTPYENLAKDRRLEDGVRDICYDCLKIENRKIYVKRHNIPLKQMLLPNFRVCIKCKRLTSYENLSKDKGGTDGVRNICIECETKRKNQDPEWKKQYNKQYRTLHHEAILQKNREYHKAHPDAGRLARKRYQSRNKKRQSALVVRYHQRYPERAKAHCQNYRSRKLNAQGRHSGEDVLQRLRDQDNCCYWCSQPLQNYHVDHYIPLSRGGTNWPENLVMTCPSCNTSKNNHLPFEEWIPPNPLFSVPIPKTERICQQSVDPTAGSP